MDPSNDQRSLALYSKRAPGISACAVAKVRSCTRHDRIYFARAVTFKFWPNLCSIPTHVSVVKNSWTSGWNRRSRTEYPVTSALLPQGRPTSNSRLAPRSRELRFWSENGPDSWIALPRTVSQLKNGEVLRYRNWRKS